MSKDGSTVAIGANLNDAGLTATENRGHVRVYRWSGAAWVKAGSDLDGMAAGDGNAGMAVSISYDGRVLAVGYPWNDAGGVSTNNRGRYQ